MEQKGIKETLEVLDFAEALGAKALGALKDGLQVSDAVAFLDKSLMDKGLLAAKGSGEVVSELKDLSFEEVQQLALRALAMAKALSEAAK